MEEAIEIKPEHRLWLHNGTVVSNLSELADAFGVMDDATFGYHLNQDKNDFHNWVKDILKDQKLADDLLKVKNQKEAFELVKKRIKEKETKAKAEQKIPIRKKAVKNKTSAKKAAVKKKTPVKRKIREMTRKKQKEIKTKKIITLKKRKEKITKKSQQKREKKKHLYKANINKIMKEIEAIKPTKKSNKRKINKAMLISAEKKPEQSLSKEKAPIPKLEKTEPKCTHYHFMQCGLKDFMVGFLVGAIVMAIIGWLLKRF